MKRQFVTCPRCGLKYDASRGVARCLRCGADLPPVPAPGDTPPAGSPQPVSSPEQQPGTREASPEAPSGQGAAQEAAQASGQSASHVRSGRADLAGRTIGGHRILGVIGRGGMGTVYLAEQLSLHRKVAFKALKRGLARDEKARTQFQKEAVSAARISHTNIVQVYDIAEDQGIQYIAMEYVQGVSLRRMMRQEGAISVPEAIGIVRQILTALTKAHQENVIHRDVKPENVLIDQDGVVKVADFGLATILEGDADARDEVRKGTPYYISPEHTRGDPTDARSDIFSVGATLYHMVTGKPPFSGDTPKEILDNALSETQIPASERNPDVPARLSAFIDRAMAKSPDERFQTAKDANAELAAIQTSVLKGGSATDTFSSEEWQDAFHDAFEASGAQQVQELAQGRRLHPAIPIVGGLLALVVAAGIVAFLLNQEEEVAPPPPPPPVHDVKPPSAMDRIEEMYDYAVKFAAERPDEYDRAIEKLRQVIAAGKQTKYAMMAGDQIARIEARRIDTVKQAFETCRARAEPLAGDDRFAEALQVLAAFPRNYVGLGIVDQELETLKEKIQADAKRRFDEVTTGALAAMKDQDFDKAKALLTRLQRFGMDDADKEAARGLRLLAQARARQTRSWALHAKVGLFGIIEAAARRASARNYRAALKSCDQAMAQPKYRAIRPELRAERQRIATAQDVFQLALKTLADTPGQPFRVRGIMGEFVRIRDGDVAIRIGTRELSEPVQKASYKEVVRLAEKALDLAKPESHLKLACFLLYELQIRDCQRMLSVAANKGANVKPLARRLETLKVGRLAASAEPRADLLLYQLRDAVRTQNWKEADRLLRDLSGQLDRTRAYRQNREELDGIRDLLKEHGFEEKRRGRTGRSRRSPGVPPRVNLRKYDRNPG